jgi:hypothetical protein
MTKTETHERYIAEVDRLLAPVNDDMRTLLRQWASCMQRPRAKDWEKAADGLCVSTRLLLGNLSAAVYDAAKSSEVTPNGRATSIPTEKENENY